MSLITQCPACATMFKVVPDQLRISDGWVRCGQCDEVFDANAHLQSNRPVVAAERPHQQDERIEISQDAAENLGEEPGIEVESPDAAVEEEIVSSAEQDGALAAEPALDFVSPEGFDEPVADTFFEKSPQEVSLAVEVSLKPEDALDDEDLRAQATELSPQLSFMRLQQAPSKWAHPLARAILALLCLLLGVVLFLQVLVHERDRLAAAEPGARQFLDSLCGVLACKISPLRQIESVVIDSSSFSKVRTDVYRLNFTLKNAASIDLATPALELTLTDLQDQAVLRRVIDVRDFAAKQAVLLQGAELTVSLPISVKLSGSTERISGYRLLAFYP